MPVFRTAISSSRNSLWSSRWSTLSTSSSKSLYNLVMILYRRWHSSSPSSKGSMGDRWEGRESWLDELEEPIEKTGERVWYWKCWGDVVSIYKLIVQMLVFFLKIERTSKTEIKEKGKFKSSCNRRIYN